MRCLIYAPTVGRGGVRRVIEVLCDVFSKRDDWQFDVLGQTYDELGMPVKWAEGMNFIQIRPVDKLPLHPHLFSFLGEHRADFFAHLKEIAGNYDVILCLSPWWGFVGDDTIDTPVVTFVPDFAFDYMDMGSVGHHFRALASIIAKQSAYTIFPSEYQRRFGDRYGFNGGVIYFSMDFTARNFDTSLSEQKRIQTKYGIPERYFLALHCYGHKGAEIIIQGQYFARKRNPALPNLVIAGLETEYYMKTPAQNGHAKMVQQTIQRFKSVIGKVYILGTVAEEDLGGLYAGANAVVTATRSEGGLSGIVLEAIQTGTPVICSEIPPFTERLSRDDVHYFPVDDAKALGRQMNNVSKSHDAAVEQIIKLRDRMSDYTINQVADCYLNTLRMVANA